MRVHDARITWCIRLLAFLTIGIAGLGLSNWITGQRLGLPFRSEISMKTNTSIGLLCLSVAVILHSSRSSTKVHVIARLLSAFAGAVGAATFAEHLFHLDLGIDQLLFTEGPGAIATSSPNRMGPPSAVMLSILGFALASISKPDAPGRSIPWLGLLTLILSVIALAGYFLNARDLYELPTITGIAPHTALSYLLLSMAVLLLRADQPPIDLLFRNDAGGQMARRLIPVALVLPPLVGIAIAKSRDANILDQNMARVVLQVLLVVPLLAFIAWTGRHLSQLAQARDRAQHDYDRAVVKADDLAAKNFETTNLLDRLLDNAPIGIAIFDIHYQAMRINPFLGELHGQSHSGQNSLHELIPEHARRLESLIGEVFKSGLSMDGIELSTSGDLAPRWFQCELFPVPDQNDAVSLVGMLMIEVTDRKRIDHERALLLESERNARAEAERAGLMKDEFLATLSHELRTPLTSIVGWSQILLSKPPTNPDIPRGLATIDRNAKALSQLINDLLDVSRIISGKLHLAMVTVNLQTVVSAALESVLPSAEAKGILMVCDFESQPLQVVGDPSRLQQVTWNLLTNAVKFTPREGKIRVVLKQAGNEAKLQIIDSGVGVKPEFLPHMFERFRQADSSTTRRFGGLGLGLSIVRQLTELHAGSVSVHSDGPDKGTTFTVTLPLASASVASDESIQRPLARDDSVLRGQRILVVDDEADTRSFVTRVLEDAGALVSSAADAAEACEKIAKQPFQLLISDIGMPFKDGYDMIREVRLRHSSARLPAIALTAFARTEDRDRCLQAGFQLHVQKPVPPQELIDAAFSLLKPPQLQAVP